jgi:hypothetical protein
MSVASDVRSGVASYFRGPTALSCSSAAVHLKRSLLAPGIRVNRAFPRTRVSLPGGGERTVEGEQAPARVHEDGSALYFS